MFKTAFIICLILTTSCNSHFNNTHTVSSNVPALTDRIEHIFTAAIFSNDTMPATLLLNGYGYDIYQDSVLYIRQRNIPALPGIAGFKTTSDAGNTAALVLYKLKNNLLPPSISVKELDSIGIK